ncbi:hypothetical protein C8R46DRAFT_432357 [Mycena filopes]|nr:hypothetical protein C8R46DRAFT_432357 [Mycena filopes]
MPTYPTRTGSVLFAPWSLLPLPLMVRRPPPSSSLPRDRHRTLQACVIPSAGVAWTAPCPLSGPRLRAIPFPVYHGSERRDRAVLWAHGVQHHAPRAVPPLDLLLSARSSCRPPFRHQVGVATALLSAWTVPIVIALPCIGVARIGGSSSSTPLANSLLFPHLASTGLL